MLANYMSRVSVLIVVLITAAGIALAQQDKWNGGAGKWSNGKLWSTMNPPKPNEDVFIYSGGADDVTLDTNVNTFIHSLTLGGKANMFTSELSDGGAQQTLLIPKGLTVGENGVLDFSGKLSVISAGTIANAGSIKLGFNVILQLTNQPNGITAVAQGSAWTIGGVVGAGGVLNNGFAKLNTVEGELDFQNTFAQTISPPGKVLKLITQGEGGGSLDVSDFSTLTINANVESNVHISTSGFGTGNNTLTINGTLTNDGLLELEGFGDTATISNMTSPGNVDVANGSSATVTGTLNNGGLVKVDAKSKLVIGNGVTNGLGYMQLANGTLGEMIGKPTEFTDGFGSIAVTGPAALGGMLDILLQGGFTPAVGSTYKIILFSPNGLTGTFAKIQNDIFNGGTEKWMVDYDNVGGFVQLVAQANKQPTPELGSILLLSTGLVSMSYGIRRRSRS